MRVICHPNQGCRPREPRGDGGRLRRTPCMQRDATHRSALRSSEKGEVLLRGVGTQSDPQTKEGNLVFFPELAYSFVGWASMNCESWTRYFLVESEALPIQNSSTFQHRH